MSKRYKVHLDISNLGECQHWIDTKPWLNWDTLVSEGDSLNELLENATLTTADQDGGSGPSCDLGSLSKGEMSRVEWLIKAEVYKFDERMAMERGES